MAITKEKKVEILNDLQAAVDNSQSIVFVNFHALPVNEVNAFRSQLREEGIGYRVAKKTLIKRALDAGNVAGELPPLEGEIAIAYADDLTAPAREVYEFSKTHKDQVKIVGGVFEGRFMNESEMMEIATIPPTPVLRGMFVNIINSPIQGLAIALNQIAEKRA